LGVVSEEIEMGLCHRLRNESFLEACLQAPKVAVRVFYLPLGDQPTGFAHMHLSTQPEILCELASLATFNVAHSVSLSPILDGADIL
jgi:hypothetical protein